MDAVEVPRDIAIISFDDIPVARSDLHSLSTMHINFEDAGLHIIDAFSYYLTHHWFS